jgi:hypothetical protein
VSTILSRAVLLLLSGFILAPVRAAGVDPYPPTVTEAEIRALVQPLDLPRPRLLVQPGEWERLRERVRQQPRFAAIADRIRRDADGMLAVAPVKRELEGRRLLNESRRALRRMLTLSLTFHLTHVQRYADRAAKEMRAVADFADWNLSHFLDVAEMTLAMAIGYDWLHEQLDEPTRATVRAAILTKGVRVPLDTAHNRWTANTNNWGHDDTGADYSRLPLQWTSDGTIPVSIHRSSWTDRSAVFFGLKAGSPSGPHGQMDIGSFVLDADGQRWAVDLGAENYHLVETHRANRWTVFRQNSLSHNTLVIGDELQVVSGKTRIVRFSDDPAFPHSVVDMSPVYAGQAATAHRGMALLRDGRVLIRDHLTGLKPGVAVRWGMVTSARPGETGSDNLQLRQRSASARLRIHQPAGAVWALVDTVKARKEWDSPNPGTVMAAFTAVAPASGTLDLAVVFSPGSRDRAAAAPPPPASPVDWSAPR